MALMVQSDMATPVLSDLGSPEQIEEFLKPALRGEKIAALAVTEPGGGSDVAALRCTARLDGDEWVIDGEKTFISNGLSCDLCVVAVKTEGSDDPLARSLWALPPARRDSPLPSPPPRPWFTNSWKPATRDGS